uniref:SJCHGC03815 protein n=1 Tax=Schistosoma japonicum TaxID=6182 RepID=Q5DFN4_SCHJA|nr:SJCHGC03815 protein [Schistosoma japonicum]
MLIFFSGTAVQISVIIPHILIHYPDHDVCYISIHFLVFPFRHFFNKITISRGHIFYLLFFSCTSLGNVINAQLIREYALKSFLSEFIYVFMEIILSYRINDNS